MLARDKYVDYFQKYITEAKEEPESWDDEEDLEKIEKDKPAPVFIENYIYMNELVLPKVRPVLKIESNRERLIDFTGNFINNHTKELSTSGPVHMFIFSDQETNFLYELVNTSKGEILELFKKVTIETYSGKLSLPLVGLLENAPHKLVITAILIDAIQNNYEDIIKCCIYIMGFAEYPMVFRDSWKIGVDEGVMNYTIEHLQNKFKIKAKNLNNMLALLYYDMNRVYLLCQEHLLKGADNSYIDYIYRVRNQIKSTFQKIAEQYYMNQQNNANQYTAAEKSDDGKLIDQEGHSSIIASLVENTYTKFITSGINTEIMHVAAESKSEVSKGILHGYVSRIFTAKSNRVYEFIENVIIAYFGKNPISIDLKQGFLNFSLALYVSITRSKNPIYENISSVLDYWLNDVINIRKDYQREATIINYKICIYRYMVMMINHYN